MAAQTLHIYDWVYKWQATSGKKIDIPKLKADIEKKVRDKLMAQKGVKKVLSVTHSDIKEAKVGLFGLKFQVSGTTTTRFTSTAVPKSPVIPAVVIAIVAVCAVAVAAIAYLTIKEISSTVKYVGEVAPEALPAVAAGLAAAPIAGVAILGILAFLILRKK